MFLFDVAVLVLASRLPFAPQPVEWLAGVAVAAVVTLAAVLTYRGITVASALARWMWEWSADMWGSSPNSVATPAALLAHQRRDGVLSMLANPSRAG